MATVLPGSSRPMFQLDHVHILGDFDTELVAKFGFDFPFSKQFIFAVLLLEETLLV